MRKAITYTAIAIGALALTGAAVVAADTIDDGRPHPPLVREKGTNQATPRPDVPARKRHRDTPRIQSQFAFASSGARLGVQITDLTEELRTYFGAPLDQGVLVARVEKDSPAEKAGVQVGDVILSVDGDPVAQSFDVVSALGGHEAGDQVTVIVVRNGTRATLTATVDQATDQTWGGSLGALPHGKPNVRMWTMDPDHFAPGMGMKAFGFGIGPETVDELEQRIQDLEKRLETLEKLEKDR